MALSYILSYYSYHIYLILTNNSIKHNDPNNTNRVAHLTFIHLIMVIKHIVISGGGPTGLLSYGAAKHLAQQGFWSHDTVETIYGTSIGSLIGAMVCLKHEWSTLDDYIIKRPWEKVIADSLEVFELFSYKGMAKLKLMDDIMRPLLESKDLTLAITLREFYEYSRISLNVFTVDLNTFQKVQLSHATHPTLPLMDAIKMSC